MHLLGTLSTERPSAAGGYATIYRRGTTTPATTYTTFAGGGSSSAATHALDGYGIAVRYVNELVEVTVYDEDGNRVFGPVVDGVNATAVEIIHPHITGTSYSDASSGVNKPTTLQLVLDKLYHTFGSDDFLVDNMGADVTVAQAFMPGIFNVRGYGAVGDGSTDDSAAIQLAVNAAAVTGGTVYFPQGTYKISSATVSVSSANVRFLGAGPAASIIKTTSVIALTIASGGTSFSASHLGFVQDTSTGTAFITCSVTTALRFYNCAFNQTRAVLGFLALSGTAHFVACQFDTQSGVTVEMFDQTASGDAIFLIACKVVIRHVQSFLNPNNGEAIYLLACSVEFAAGASFTFVSGNTGSKVYLICNRFAGDGNAVHLIANTPLGKVVEYGSELVSGSGVDLINGNTGWYHQAQTRDASSLRTSTSATTYTPDARLYMSHEVVSSGASFAWLNPSGSPNLAGGVTMLLLRYKNTSGGAITPTFDTKYKASSVSVGNNQACGWLFVWDSTLACWLQIGSPVAYAS